MTGRLRIFGFPLLVLAMGWLAGCAGVPLQWDQGETPDDRLAAIEERLDRLEQQLEVQDELQLIRTVEELQEAVRRLRGTTEEQEHALDSLRSGQRDMYVDLDRRLRELEVGDTPDAAARQRDGGRNADEEQAYQQAFEMLREGRYEQAISAFDDFLERYADGAYGPNARYWLGEAHYVSRQFDQARAEFEQVLTDYPDSNKVPDARLKLGFIHYEQENWRRAREILEQVRREHADTSAAELAAERLQRMDSEGR